MTEPDEPADGGVLASLPSTRPQRRSPKRAPDATAPAAPAPRTRARAASPPTEPAAPARRTRARPTRATKAPPEPTKPAAVAAEPARRTRARPTRATKAPPEPTKPVAVAADPVRPAPVAAQGFAAVRGAVDPPSRTDLLGSVLGGAGELAEIGVAAGRQVLRAIYGRLPHP